MKTKNKLSENNDKKAKKRSLFWDFMGGEFLLKESVVRWYPFVIILLLFAIIAAQNEASIIAKEKKINKLYIQYNKRTLTNSPVYRDVSPEIMELIKEQGFIRKDGATFKVIDKPTKKKQKAESRKQKAESRKLTN